MKSIVALVVAVLAACSTVSAEEPASPACPPCAAKKAMVERLLADPSASLAEQGEGLEALLLAAGGAVLVEILSADTRAMASDGPMQVEARVVKRVKGPNELREGATLRFEASAWIGPTYAPGEHRVVLLSPTVEPGSAPWSSLETFSVDLFYANDPTAPCSEEALAALLRSVGRASPRPRAQFSCRVNTDG